MNFNISGNNLFPKFNPEFLKKSAVILSVLENYDDIWISKKPNGTISIEQMDGKICSFIIENGEIVYQSGSFAEVSADKKTAIKKGVQNFL